MSGTTHTQDGAGTPNSSSSSHTSTSATASTGAAAAASISASGGGGGIGGGIFQGWRSARTFRPRWKDNNSNANNGGAGGSKKEKGNDGGGGLASASGKTNAWSTTANDTNNNNDNYNYNSDLNHENKDLRHSNQAHTSSTGKQTSSSDSGNKTSSKFRHHIDVTLGSGNLRSAVKLPAGEDYDEWLAVNTIDFYNAINLLYGVVSEFCTEVCVGKWELSLSFFHVFRFSSPSLLSFCVMPQMPTRTSLTITYLIVCVWS